MCDRGGTVALFGLTETLAGLFAGNGLLVRAEKIDEQSGLESRFVRAHREPVCREQAPGEGGKNRRAIGPGESLCFGLTENLFGGNRLLMRAEKIDERSGRESRFVRALQDPLKAICLVRRF